MSGTVPLFEKMQAYEDEITRLRAQIEQERAVQTRLTDEVDRLEALLLECLHPINQAAHIAAGQARTEETQKMLRLGAKIEALK